MAGGWEFQHMFLSPDGWDVSGLGLSAGFIILIHQVLGGELPTDPRIVSGAHKPGDFHGSGGKSSTKISGVN